MTCVSARHIVLTSNQPVGNAPPEWVSNPPHPYLKSRALSTELPRFPLALRVVAWPSNVSADRVVARPDKISSKKSGPEL